MRAKPLPDLNQRSIFASWVNTAPVLRSRHCDCDSEHHREHHPERGVGRTLGYCRVSDMVITPLGVQVVILGAKADSEG